MLTVKQGDTHDVYWQVLDGDSPIDLTGMTAEIHIQKKGGAVIVLDADVDAATKRVKHTLTGTLEPGTYALEIELNDSGVIATAPTAKNDTLVVVKQIA